MIGGRAVAADISIHALHEESDGMLEQMYEGNS